MLKVFRKDSKLVEYCKICKTYVADLNVIKKKAKRLTLMAL